MRTLNVLSKDQMLQFKLDQVAENINVFPDKRIKFFCTLGGFLPQVSLITIWVILLLIRVINNLPAVTTWRKQTQTAVKSSDKEEEDGGEVLVMDPGTSSEIHHSLLKVMACSCKHFPSAWLEVQGRTLTFGISVFLFCFSRL